MMEGCMVNYGRDKDMKIDRNTNFLKFANNALFYLHGVSAVIILVTEPVTNKLKITQVKLNFQISRQCDRNFFKSGPQHFNFVKDQRHLSRKHLRNSFCERACKNLVSSSTTNTIMVSFSADPKLLYQMMRIVLKFNTIFQGWLESKMFLFTTEKVMETVNWRLMKHKNLLELVSLGFIWIIYR